VLGIHVFGGLHSSEGYFREQMGIARSCIMKSSAAAEIEGARHEHARCVSVAFGERTNGPNLLDFTLVLSHGNFDSYLCEASLLT